MIIPENGVGIAGANSYATVEAADLFHDLRQNAAWLAATEAQKVAALVRATDFIEASYRASAAPLMQGQGLQFPTSDPRAFPMVVGATILLSLDALSGPLNSRQDRGIKSTKGGVGPLSDEIVYDDAAPTDPYPHVTAALAHYATPAFGGGFVRVGRLIR